MLRRTLLKPAQSSPDPFLSIPRSLYRVFAWFLVLYFGGLYLFLLTETPEALGDLEFLDIFISVPGFVGAMCYAYRCTILHPWFWRLYLPFMVGWDAWFSLDNPWTFDLLIHYLILTGLYYGLFRLATDSDLWKPKEPPQEQSSET